MNENIITWNMPNWITVVLMVSLGFAILGAAAGVMRKRSANSDE